MVVPRTAAAFLLALGAAQEAAIFGDRRLLVPDCECLDEWTTDEPGCEGTQMGCAESCDGEGRRWCMVQQRGCAQDYEAEGWAYCGMPEPCRCLATWTSEEDGEACATSQTGCPTLPCDDGERPWCMVANPGCAEEEGREEWAYCTPEAPQDTATSATRGLACAPPALAAATASVLLVA